MPDIRDLQDLQYDGKPVEKRKPEPELNEDEMIGDIMRRMAEAGHLLTYEEVQAVIDTETEYLRKKGFIDN